MSHAHRDYAFTAAAYATFIRDRVARLFPLHWAGLALTAVVLALTPAIQQACRTASASSSSGSTCC